MKHTEGPWIHRKDYYGVWHIESDSCDAWIAKTVPMRDLFTKKALFDTEADARLIAAAPDLLSALKSLDKRLRSCIDVEGISVSDAYDSFYQDLVSAAIAKATGEGV